MTHYCIFQIFKNGTYKYIEDFNEKEFITEQLSKEASEDFINAYNNLRNEKEQKEFYFIGRRLEEIEFKNIKEYNPINYKYVFN